jgi:hypothetical protein
MVIVRGCFWIWLMFGDGVGIRFRVRDKVIRVNIANPILNNKIISITHI